MSEYIKKYGILDDRKFIEVCVFQILS